MKPRDYIEILVCKWLVKRLKKGYGANCPDQDDNILLPGGCTSCKARLVVDFLEEHIEIIKI